MSPRRALSAEERMLRRTAVRAGAQSALAVAVTVAVLCGVAILVVLRSQHDDQNTLLSTTIDRVDDVNDPPADMWLVIRHDGHQNVSPGLPAGLPDEAALVATAADGRIRVSDLLTAHQEYSVRTQRRGDDVVQAILDLHTAHLERDRLLQALLVTGGIGLLLAALTGAGAGRRALAPLAQALALQRRFVADAGHELRTPLTLLSTRVQLLQRRTRQTDFQPDVDSLVTEVKQLTAILDDLLLAADPREHTPTQQVDLATLVNQAVTAARPTAAEQDVTLSARSVEGVRITGTETALRRAVNALLDNGIRHARSSVDVTVRATGRQAIIEIADDGPGIDPTAMPALFARFATGPPQQHNGRRRYGLGLALASDIAARHRGTVTAHNADTGGAVLRLLLPRG